ncbi:hypothetical protein [Paracoccus beibuensis]|uniref:hypothetical protein n=1 Tax=Paracoccus beibuensis TaxID=547602 RepID=UPI0022403657|nr:hypothetical protein [Paracoccus beibuensis]
MPLTHFLVLICAVVVGAALTLWVSLAAGLPVVTILLLALSCALLVHLGQRDRHDH